MGAQQQRVQSLGGGGGSGSSGANLETMAVQELQGIAAAQGVSPDIEKFTRWRQPEARPDCSHSGQVNAAALGHLT